MPSPQLMSVLLSLQLCIMYVVFYFRGAYTIATHYTLFSGQRQYYPCCCVLILFSFPLPFLQDYFLFCFVTFDLVMSAAL